MSLSVLRTGRRTGDSGLLLLHAEKLLYVHPIFTSLFLPVSAPVPDASPRLRALTEEAERLRLAVRYAKSQRPAEAPALEAQLAAKRELIAALNADRVDGESSVWTTSDAVSSMAITALAVPGPDGQGAVPLGVPYGAHARLLLVYLQTAARVLQTREIPLGDSIYGLLNALGIRSRTGGKNGSLPAVTAQLLRLANMSIAITNRQNATTDLVIARTAHQPLVESTELAWVRNPNGVLRVVEGRSLILSESFYNALQAPRGEGAPVPLQRQVLLHPAVRGFARAWDLYMHLRGRFYRLRNSDRRTASFTLTEFAAMLGKRGRMTGTTRKELLSAIGAVHAAWPQFSFGRDGRRAPYNLTWNDRDDIVLTAAASAPP